jgi:hypothetical protein
MYFGIFFICLGLYLLYMVFDFVFGEGMNINSYGNKWLEKLAWLWVPIYGISRLTKEVILKKKK